MSQHDVFTESHVEVQEFLWVFPHEVRQQIERNVHMVGSTIKEDIV